MPSTDRLFDRGSRRGINALRQLGDEFRDQRLGHGLSQGSVAIVARISRSRLSRIEGSKVLSLSIVEASQIAAVLGLELGVRAFPGGSPLRDSAHANRLRSFLSHVPARLTCRTEVPLPTRDGRPEQRAWDAMIFGRGMRCGVELEMRLRDVQALERRINLKRRDDPVESFVLLVADTRTNRRVLREHHDVLGDLPRLRFATVVDALEKGEHPPTSLVLV